MELARSGSGSKTTQQRVEMLRKELDLLNASIDEVDAFIESETSVKYYAHEARKVASFIEGVIDQFNVRHVHRVRQENNLKIVYDLLRKLTGGSAENDKRYMKKVNKLLSEVHKGDEAHDYIRDFMRKGGYKEHRFPSTSLVLMEYLVGDQAANEDMMKEFFLGGESRRSAFVVVGIAGIGKTTLAQRIYNNKAVREYFDIRAWTSKGDGCITAEEIQRQVVEDGAGSVREFLSGKRYLIVFDDVCTEDLWGIAKDMLPDDSVGSRVVVTTRNQRLGKYFIDGPSDHIHEVGLLMEEESWELFSMLAFRYFHEGRCPEELRQVSAEIVALCKGWPAVIRVVAGMLGMHNKDMNEWERVLQNLKLEKASKLAKNLNVISRDFIFLTPCLKKCFMLFNFFARKQLIQNDKLIRLWIAEGFVQEIPGRTMEEVAEEYLKELIDMNLVKACNGLYGFNKFCCAHEYDILYKLARIHATNLEFCMVDDGMSSESRLERKCRRVTISSAASLRTHLNTVDANEPWVVRSIFLSNTGPLDRSILVELFMKHHLLTILDLEKSRLEILPKEVGNLSCLKYLSLKNTGVKETPKTIGVLYRLQVLNLSGSLLVGIPSEIAKLGCLRHLLASRGDVDETCLDSSKGLKIEEGIGAVASLQTLTTVDAKLSGINVIQEMKKLNQLRCLKVTRLTYELVRALSACISEMSHLKSLHLESMKNEVLDLQNVASPPIQMEYLVLKGELSCIPNWISHLGYIRLICLSLSNLLDDPIPSLRLLPNLESLWFTGLTRVPDLSSKMVLEN